MSVLSYINAARVDELRVRALQLRDIELAELCEKALLDELDDLRPVYAKIFAFEHGMY